ncbi:FliH/SctL family protein [Pisciglobus halotolerans]|uniref:Flagellar assembly protein FliH n=1 Tax=Pisciglobus halotolerans TaxID=745365 RepID=A0A1I3AN92_9LACT|nr:FliH/SctL family protein [Pisciglobus halotolerans]SFH51485.1 flagellar assembly protein FliH [Pisciglobus halotolerans]
MSLSHKIIKAQHALAEECFSPIKTDVLAVPVFSRKKEESSERSALEKEKSNLYLLEAQREADALIKQAKEEAAVLKQTAEQEGYAVGQQQGYQEGYTHGYQEAMVKGQAESEQLKQHAVQLLLEAEEQTQLYYKEKKEEWLELAAVMAENIVHETIDASSEKVLSLVYPVIHRLKKEDQLILLTVRPDQKAFVKEKLSHLEQQAEARFVVLTDHSLERNGCIIETAHSITDLQVSRQLENMLDEMKKME